MADGYISQIKLPNEETYDFRDRNLKVYTGSCSTAAGTAIKDVVTDGIFTLEKGAVLFVNFTNTNSTAVGNLKLKINGEADTNAKPIKYLVNGNDPANIPGAGYLRANQTYMFRYDGTNWVADLNYYTYSNDFANKIGHYNNILARKAIAAESLIVGDETGYEKVASGVTFNLAYPIVWCTGAVNANASNYANMFLQHYDRNIATGAKSGFTSTANKAIYLIVTINGNIATIDSNIITDTLPSSDDGKVYISLGKLGAQSTGANYFFLYPVHPMFWYKNGAIREYSGASQYALTAPLSGISGADDLKAIEAIGETTGLLRKTAANTWTLDTSNYVTSSGITSVTIGATSPVQSSTSTAQTSSSASTTISLKDAYGDTKNPYGAKAKNLILAGPASGSNAAPGFRALVAADIPSLAYVPATGGVNDVNTLVNTGVYNITSGSATNTPKGYGYGQLLVMSYRKHTGNTTTDWASQLYLHNGGGTASGSASAPGNVLYYRTSNSASSNTWFDWQKAVHVDDTYTKVGDTNKPVYIAADGTATPISYTIAKSVPSDAVFTDTNKYHKTGSWNGLTYTATAVNSADELKFTIPNKIQTNWELNAASGNSPALLFTRDGTLTDWKVFVNSGKLSFQSATNGTTWTERAYFKDNSGDFVANSFTGDGSQLTSLKTQNLVRPAGLNGVNDVTYQALINDVRANRLAFLPADQIIIEKTTDGGITWEDAGISDGIKTALFSETRPGVSIPKINNEINTNCGLRITITAMKYDVPAGTLETQKYNYWNSSYVKSTERYNQIKLMYFWVSTATNALKVTVQKATGANPNSWINVFSNNNYGMTGWSGNDVITFGQGVFGGGTTQTGNTWNWRITLMTCGPNGSDTLTQSNLTSTMMVSEIRGYGDTYWTAGNKYAASDHLYSWDYNKNATFPSNITASKFIGALQGNADTAIKFNSTRKIELTGAVTGSATTDGSSGWTISTTVNHNHDDRYSIASGVITLGSNTITPVTSVNGHSGSSVSVTASDLGLASALKYVGTKSSLPTATDSTTYSTYNNGDVITVSAKEYAYVKGSNAAGSSWVELGDEGSYKLRQTAFTNSTGTADGTNTSTSFIYSFSQDENGAISNIKTRQLPTLTNVSYTATAATDDNEYPVLMKNSTGSDTTAAGVRFASGTNQQVTINPSTGTVSTRRLVINNSSSNGTVPDLVFSRTSWSYINIPDNDAAVLAIGRGTGDNASQKLIIQGDGVVRPGSDNTQMLGKSTRRWKEVHGVNFYGTFNGTATYSQGLAKWAISNSDLNNFVSNGALRYSWEGGNNGFNSKPTDVNAFGVIAMKTATNWTGQLLMSTDSEPGLYWRTNLTTETPSYGSWTPLASGNGGVYYGTCETAANTVEKEVVCKHYHTLKAGDIIVVTFTNANTEAQPKLNVNNTGAVYVKMAYSGGIVDLGSTTQLSYTCTFIYDGTYWLIINQQNTIQLATASNQTNWRSILLSNSNSGDENFTPSANTLGRTYAAHNVKYQPSTGTLRAPIMKTPKVQIEYDHVNKAHIQWNDTDSSIDFIFD